jgi:hypothetical protein
MPLEALRFPVTPVGLHYLLIHYVRTRSAARRGAGWAFDWDAPAGEHVVCCRARDAAGNEQPLEAEWNVGGYANNAVQRVAVTVG